MNARRGANMQVQFLKEGERLIAQPDGRMEAADADEFAAAAGQQLAAGIRGLTIDLARLDFISLGAVRGLLRLGRALKAGGRDLDFRHGDAHVRHALDQAGMGEFFPFTPALHSHRGHHHEAS
jgi:anti-anti-sigma regulatory factor